MRGDRPPCARPHLGCFGAARCVRLALQCRYGPRSAHVVRVGQRVWVKVVSECGFVRAAASHSALRHAQSMGVEANRPGWLGAVVCVCDAMNAHAQRIALLNRVAALEWSSSRRLGHRRCASHFGPLAVYLFFHPAVPRPYSVFDAYPACHVPAARVANRSSGPGRRDEPARAGIYRWHCQCGTSTKRLAATLTCSTSCWPRSRR